MSRYWLHAPWCIAKYRFASDWDGMEEFPPAPAHRRADTASSGFQLRGSSSRPDCSPLCAARADSLNVHSKIVAPIANGAISTTHRETSDIRQTRITKAAFPEPLRVSADALARESWGGEASCSTVSKPFCSASTAAKLLFAPVSQEFGGQQRIGNSLTMKKLEGI